MTVVPTAITIPSTSTTTIAPNPLTTAVYTLVGAVRRSPAEIQKRAVSIQAFVIKFASSATSQACSCLSLTTPTSSATVQVTSIATNTATATSVITSPVTISTTVVATLTSPVTIVTTLVDTSTAVVNTGAFDYSDFYD